LGKFWSLVCIFLVKTPPLRREMETIKWVQRALEKTRSNRVGVKALRGVGGNNPLVRYKGAVGGPHHSVRAGRQQV
jgi:hypothetical protein